MHFRLLSWDLPDVSSNFTAQCLAISLKWGRAAIKTWFANCYQIGWIMNLRAFLSYVLSPLKLRRRPSFLWCVIHLVSEIFITNELEQQEFFSRLLSDGWRKQLERIFVFCKHESFRAQNANLSLWAIQDNLSCSFQVTLFQKKGNSSVWRYMYPR